MAIARYSIQMATNVPGPTFFINELESMSDFFLWSIKGGNPSFTQMGQKECSWHVHSRQVIWGMHSRQVIWGTPKPSTAHRKITKVWPAVRAISKVTKDRTSSYPIQGTIFFPVKLFPLENYYVPVLTAANVHLKQLLLEWGEKQVHNLLKKRALLRPFSLQFLTRTVSGPMY